MSPTNLALKSEIWSLHVPDAMRQSLPSVGLSERDVQRWTKTLKRLLEACPTLLQDHDNSLDTSPHASPDLLSIGQKSWMDFSESLSRV